MQKDDVKQRSRLLRKMFDVSDIVFYAYADDAADVHRSFKNALAQLSLVPAASMSAGDYSRLHSRLQHFLEKEESKSSGHCLSMPERQSYARQLVSELVRLVESASLAAFESGERDDSSDSERETEREMPTMMMAYDEVV